MAFLLPVGTKVALTVSFTDADGKPARVDGTPVWASSDEAIVSVVAEADGLSATATNVSAGAAQVSVRADARFGPEVVELIGTLDVESLGPEAVTVTITAGTPEPV